MNSIDGHCGAIETTTEPRHCNKCKKPEFSLEAPFRLCSKCKSTSYCSRECWKSHKKTCVAQATQTGGAAISYSTPQRYRPKKKIISKEGFYPLDIDTRKSRLRT